MDSIERIAAACGKPRRSRRGWMCCCVCHRDRSPSMELIRGHSAILVKCYAGCRSADLVQELRARGFDLGTGRRAGAPKPPPPPPQTEDDKLADMARAVWAESVSARSTPVEFYLAGRGLVLPALVNGAVIRWHPHCPRGKERRPAMVTALRDAENDRLIGIHRTFLTRDYKRDGNKMMLGRAGVAKLGSHEAVLAAKRLTGCEGIETGLALMMQGHAPVWAFGSAGALARCPLLEGVDALLLCIDNDKSRTGWRAGQQTCWRWLQAGRACEMKMVDSTGWDFADLETLDAG
ncbi:MAG: toprim domain-containing protein [Rhizobiales bacterium]|nr:toprim domain-containing protein [Hyphomicrobiales bacterium]